MTPDLPDGNAPGDAGSEGWLVKRPVVLVLLFCVLGPLAIRLLWKSPYFTKVERVVLSILSVVEVVLILNLLVQIYLGYLMGIGADGPT